MIVGTVSGLVECKERTPGYCLDARQEPRDGRTGIELGRSNLFTERVSAMATLVGGMRPNTFCGFDRFHLGVKDVIIKEVQVGEVDA